MRAPVTWLAVLVATSAGAGSERQAPPLAIDHGGITVSGISAGGAMAQQLHLAYPDLFSGAGIIAGVPWGCAEGSLATALGRCTATAAEPLPVEAFIDRYRAAAQAGRVGDPALLGDDRAWLFHGALDVTIAERVTRAAVAVYGALLEGERIEYVGEVEAAHTFPTLETGNPCDAVQPPFVGACAYDAAGEMLQYLYPGLTAPDREAEPELEAVPLPGAAAAGLAETAWLYRPESCPEAGCRLHLVLHGCTQSEARVGRQFMEGAGYLPWAAANRIVLAFPQVAASPVNPGACWDWWGYTGQNYLDRDAPQMKVLTDWIRGLSG